MQQLVESRVRSAILSLPFVDPHGTVLDGNTLLVEDLGFDSLRFVDLVLSLELHLELSHELPMQDWVDHSIAANLPLSLGRLVAFCEGQTRNG